MHENEKSKREVQDKSFEKNVKCGKSCCSEKHERDFKEQEKHLLRKKK